jgi:gamma-glutamylcyclotransferase
MTMLYFAYGSNMLTERLKARVPSTRPISPAILSDYDLRFHKRSTDKSGKCDIIKSDC